MARHIIVCAHRGRSGVCPENTMAAFRAAWELEVDMIELDVAMTADGVLVVLHDRAVDRTTTGTGNIDELEADYVERLDAGRKKDAKFTGERVPLLGEVLEAAPRQCRLNIHVKPYAPSIERLVEAVVGTMTDGELLKRAYVTSEAEVVQLAQRADNRVVTCNLSGQGGDGTEYIMLSRQLGCTILQPSNALVTKEFCDAARHAGLEVNPFYADDIGEMARLISCGVDGILTNYPEILLKLLGRL
jgi:glycerophosphoryl diester phosphodiesterase